MNNIKPYDSSESKKNQVKDMFSRVAKRYDMLNHLLSAGVDYGWRRDVVRIVAQQSPQTLLDVATGTGDLAIAMGKAMPTVRITGVDLCEEMLVVARTKNANPKITFIQGDAEQLSVEDETMDVVTAAFGVRNFENLEQGLREMRRVLKSGGKLVILEFSMPENRIINAIYSFYFKKLLPLVGGIVSGDRGAYDYLPRSVEGSVYGDEFVELLKRIGFQQVKQKIKMSGIATIYTAAK